MEKKAKLGRGLDEVSHFYLSAAKKEEPDAGTPPRVNRNIVSVHHSGSDAIQSFFLSNLALELAKYQFPIYILDFCDNQDMNIKSKMKRLIKSQGSSSRYSVTLYGLPSIQVVEVNPYEDDSIEDILSTANINGDTCFVFLNTQNSLKINSNRNTASEFIVLTKTDKISLLQSYAYIKFILEKSEKNKIYLILDEIDEEQEATRIYRRFAEYVERKLSHTINYLGGLTHDEYLSRSIEEGKPLVLSQEKSITKEKVLLISKNFFTLSNFLELSKDNSNSRH
ncbi:MAG: MinD/ParA family ATP-binding protein [bacterium]